MSGSAGWKLSVTSSLYRYPQLPARLGTAPCRLATTTSDHGRLGAGERRGRSSRVATAGLTTGAVAGRSDVLGRPERGPGSARAVPPGAADPGGRRVDVVGRQHRVRVSAPAAGEGLSPRGGAAGGVRAQQDGRGAGRGAAALSGDRSFDRGVQACDSSSCRWAARCRVGQSPSSAHRPLSPTTGPKRLPGAGHVAAPSGRRGSNAPRGGRPVVADGPLNGPAAAAACAHAARGPGAWRAQPEQLRRARCAISGSPHPRGPDIAAARGAPVGWSAGGGVRPAGPPTRPEPNRAVASRARESEPGTAVGPRRVSRPTVSVAPGGLSTCRCQVRRAQPAEPRHPPDYGRYPQQTN